MRLFASTWVVLALGLTDFVDLPSASPAEVYLSPTGSDTDRGTQAHPFATLTRARDEVRRIIAAGLKQNVTVILLPGTYRLDAPVRFLPEDGGDERFSVTYAAAPGAQPVLTGRRVISGWQKGEAQLWTARVTDPVHRASPLADLIVGETRAIRARTPNIDSDPPGWRLANAGDDNLRQIDRLMFERDQLQNWARPADIEVTCYNEWEITRKRVASIDVATNTVTLAPPHLRMAAGVFQPGPKKGCYFENAREFLDQPGEWYYDRAAGIMTYWPRDGENLDSTPVVAPALDRLVIVRGKPNQPVRNLHFRGLKFRDTSHTLPNVGYYGMQGCYHWVAPAPAPKKYNLTDRVPSAVSFEMAQDCSLTNS